MKPSKDMNLLRTVADFRLATTPLLANCLGTSEQMIRRRCRTLAAGGLLKVMPRESGHGRGRPESLISLKPEGVQALATAKLLPSGIPVDQVTGERLERMCGHQLIVNWLALQFTTEKLGDRFAVRFISATTPFYQSKGGGTILRDKVEFQDGTEAVFTPDAAVCITHRKLQKSLLFLLEIDMGTEVVADPKHASNVDLRRKIIVYRTYLGRRGYKRYDAQRFFNTPFNGFRLLLVTATKHRYETLCRLVRAMSPSEFVWLTDQSTLVDGGLNAPVWSQGGKQGSMRSILKGGETSAPEPASIRKEWSR